MNDDPRPTYRGFRHQALFTLIKILDDTETRIFQPEGIEDLAVYSATGELLEVIQVKSHTSDLTASSLGNAFYLRSSEHIRNNPDVPIKIISYGPIGQNLTKALLKNDLTANKNLIRYVERIVGDGRVATHIVHLLKIETVSEEDIVPRIIEKLSSMCTGVEPKYALEALWWWVYSASESKTVLDQKLVIKKITEIGKFVTQRTAFYSEWFKTIIPLEDIEVSEGKQEELSREFALGVRTRFEHIVAGVDVCRDSLLNRMHQVFETSNIVLLHGASGQGKTALACRYCFDFFPTHWRYCVDFIENRSHARNIAIALTGHAEATSAKMIVIIDVQPGDVWWVDLAKHLAMYQTINVLVTVREEDLRRVSGQLTEFPHNAIELTLDEIEAQAIYDSIRISYDLPHVLNFQDAWRSFGNAGPLLEFTYFLRHNDTLEARLKHQVMRIQDAVRCGEFQPQELDFLRMIAVATSYEAWVDLRLLAIESRLPEPMRTVELFEKEYFLRLTPDKEHVTALHPIRSKIISRLLTDDVLSPWQETAGLVLRIIRERDLERYLLSIFLNKPNLSEFILESVIAFHPKTWTGLCGCMRALLWLGVKQYTDENEPLIRDVFARSNEGWYIMIKADIAGIADFDLTERFASLGDIGQKFAETSKSFLTRQSDTNNAFKHYISYMQSKSHPVLPPSSGQDWQSLGEVCFWLGHMQNSSPIVEWITESLFQKVLLEESVEAFSEACIGIYTLWGDRYHKWYDNNRDEIHAKLRSMIRAVSINEKNDTLFATFIISKKESALLAGRDASSGIKELSLNDLVVAKLRAIRNTIPFNEKYGCEGIGHLSGIIDLPHDESRKSGVLKRYLMPRWGPDLNNLFIRLGDSFFRLPTWTRFSEEVNSIRRKTLEILEQLRAGIFAHYKKKETIRILDDYIQVDKWESLKSNVFSICYLPKCAVDNWGLDAAKSTKYSKLLNSKHLGPNEDLVAPYRKAAREYARSLNNFLSQAPEILIWNTVVGKAKKKRDKLKLVKECQTAGIKNVNWKLSSLNLEDLCKSLFEFQKQADKIFSDRIGFDEHKRLSRREMELVPNICLLWKEFTKHPKFIFNGANRIKKNRRLQTINAEEIASNIKENLQKNLNNAGSEGIDFYILNKNVSWESKPTLWVVCNSSDPLSILYASRIAERPLRKTISEIRTSESKKFVSELYWPQIVVLPVVAGKALRKLAYPHMWNVAHRQDNAETNELFHLPLPVAEKQWTDIGLKQWRQPILKDFQHLTDSISKLCEKCGHFADFIRIDQDLDELGVEIAQKYFQVEQESLSTQLQDALDQKTKIFDIYDALPASDTSQRPMLNECIALLSELDDKLLPRKEWSGAEKITINEIKEWHSALIELVEAVFIAELFWSADLLGLECDISKLEAIMRDTKHK